MTLIFQIVSKFLSYKILTDWALVDFFSFIFLHINYYALAEMLSLILTSAVQYGGH